MIEWLIRNRTIGEDTVLIVDEPESGLNPASIVKLAEVIYKLSKKGLLVFVATHNFFFLKKTQILARKDRRKDAKIFALESRDGKIAKDEEPLSEKIPANKILEIAMDLYSEDVKLVMEDILK